MKKHLPLVVALACAGTASVNAIEMTDEERIFLSAVRPVIPAVSGVAWEVHESRGFESGGGTADWQIIEVSAPIGFTTFGSRRAAVAFGLDYSFVDLSTSQGGVDFGADLHSLFLSATGVYRPEGSKWFYGGQIAPGLRTDFDSIGSDDFAFRSFVGAGRQVSDTFGWGYGAYVSMDADGYFFAPGVAFAWAPSEKWMVGLIPPQLGVSYQPSDGWLISLAVLPRSYSANLGSDSGIADYASVSYLRTALSVRRKISERPGIWLSAAVGGTFFGDVDVKRDDRRLFDSEIDPGLYGRIGLEIISW